LFVAAAAPTAAAAPGWPDAAVDAVAGGVVVEVWTTVVVFAGAVTVLVRDGSVTVSVRGGSVTVSVLVAVFSVTVCVVRPDPLDASVAVVLSPGDLSVPVVPAVVLLFVVADKGVEVVRVCVTLLAAL
jgi:hypothetical protein